MADNINLLPDQTSTETPVTKQNALVNQISTIVLVLTILATAGIFGANFYFGQQIDSLQQEISSLGSEVNQHKDTEGVYRSAAARIEASQEFLASQNRYSRLLAAVRQSVPEGVTLTDLAVDTTQSVTLTGVALSYVDVSAMAAKLKSMGNDSVKDFFIDTSVTSITREESSPGIAFGASFKVDRRLITGEDQ